MESGQNHRREGREMSRGEKPVKHRGSTTPSSPHSKSSSPSPEFSFTISLHSSSTRPVDKAKHLPSFDIDLSPADDIFFHGHLLPLHLISQRSQSPRSSTNSLDSLNLPAMKNTGIHTSHDQNISCDWDDAEDLTEIDYQDKGKDEIRATPKRKPFSLFRWRKGNEIRGGDKEKSKGKIKFDVIKKYVKKVEPLFSFRGRKDDGDLPRHPFSIPSNLIVNNKQDVQRLMRGRFSVPVSRRTSPTHSGRLVGSVADVNPRNADGTMEELQSAIQAAIAHCKSSIGPEPGKKMNT